MKQIFSFRLSSAQTWLVVGVASTLYIKILYFTDRTDFSALFSAYLVLFILYFLMVRTNVPAKNILIMGILLRALSLFAVPNLSDDFYRFYWDGLLSVHGVNPFSFLPAQLMEAGTIESLTETLFQNLNSRDYYTIYPPFCQFIYMISALLSNGNIYIGTLVMRIFSISAEIGSALLIIRMLRGSGLEVQRLTYYWFNPLVVLELSGNLHPEVYMIFFVLLAMYCLTKNRNLLGALFFSVAIASKLLPLILLPFFFKRLGFKQVLGFYAYTGLFTLLLFLPLLGEAFIHGFTSSFLLYFQKFEFNASIYYIIREIGFWMVGWNIIGMAGKWLAAVVLVSIIALALFEDHKKLHATGVFIWPLCIYFALSTTVHPWYITPIVAFSLFSKYRFPLLWSFMVFFSYQGYYAGGYNENALLVWIEYIAVAGMVAYEFYSKGAPETVRFNPGSWFKQVNGQK